MLGAMFFAGCAILVASDQRQLSTSQQQHLWDMFKLRNVFLGAKFVQGSWGELFSAKTAKGDLVAGISVDRLRQLSLVFPEASGWRKRVVVQLPAAVQGHYDLTVTLTPDALQVFDGCFLLLNNQLPEAFFKFDTPQLKLVPSWNGPQPEDLRMDSGYPMGEKCSNISVLSPKYTIEDIEKESKKSHPLSGMSISVSKIAAPPSNFTGCVIDDEMVAVGEQTSHNCTTCFCVSNDNVECRAEECPRLDCSLAVKRPDQCCPSCGRQCIHDERQHEHGELSWVASCVRCECWDGRLTCQFQHPKSCPTLGCAISQQFMSKNNCCPVCRENSDFCSLKPCHADADCFNEKQGAKCRCKEGFSGNGTHCLDINECSFGDDARAQLGGCSEGTTCVNMKGTFRCDCLPGFQRLDERNCAPLFRI